MAELLSSSDQPEEHLPFLMPKLRRANAAHDKGCLFQQQHPMGRQLSLTLPFPPMQPSLPLVTTNVGHKDLVDDTIPLEIQRYLPIVSFIPLLLLLLLLFLEDCWQSFWSSLESFNDFLMLWLLWLLSGRELKTIDKLVHVVCFGFLPFVNKTNSWYHGSITRRDAEKRLRPAPAGSFLVRDSMASHDDYFLAAR